MVLKEFGLLGARKNQTGIIEFLHLLFDYSLIGLKIVEMLKSIQRNKLFFSLFPPVIISSLNRVVIGYDKGTIMIKVLSSHSGGSMGIRVEEEEKKEC